MLSFKTVSQCRGVLVNLIIRDVSLLSRGHKALLMDHGERDGGGEREGGRVTSNLQTYQRIVVMSKPIITDHTGRAFDLKTIVRDMPFVISPGQTTAVVVNQLFFQSGGIIDKSTQLLSVLSLLTSPP